MLLAAAPWAAASFYVGIRVGFRAHGEASRIDLDLAFERGRRAELEEWERVLFTPPEPYLGPGLRRRSKREMPRA